MKKKLNLKELEVKSFVTSLENTDSLKGGGKIPTLDGCFTGNYPTINGQCPTVHVACPVNVNA